ncbi:ATP-binding protein [Granulicoccus phenolivorans]|uniref:ATP-binding protein n=1 Tax=Granulicoccus phenolivorans TaxID=266854 RepID=UPI000684FF8E|nr:ATP-binding protein [Granulicoccus phenolivorans]
MTLTSFDIVELVDELRSRGGDSASIEVKSGAGGCPDVADTLCAFANMPDGGTLIVGLDEASGFAPVGLTELATIEQGIASQARTAVTPPVRCDFDTVTFGGSDLLVCRVAGIPLLDRPARHGSRAFLRQSDGDYAMSEQELAQLRYLQAQAVQRKHPDHESVLGTSSADLDEDLTRAYLSAARANSARHASVSDTEILRRTSVLSHDNSLTLGGLYTLGKYPQQWRPTLGITAAVQLPRGSGSRTRDLVHLDGPLPELLDRAMEWVRRNTSHRMSYNDGGHGIDTPEVPMRAVRELIANALVHRDLSATTDSKRVEIRLKDDLLVITSPGGLWGISEGQLGHPEGKSAVNSFLYEICKNVRLPDGTRVIEGEGGGIREAILATREAGLRPPRFTDYGVRFTALLSRHTLLSQDDLSWLATLPGGGDLSSEQRAILAGMRHGAQWTNSSVRTDFPPVDSVEARRWLQQLVERGFAEAVGERGQTTYQLSPALRVPTGAEATYLPIEAPAEVVDLGPHTPTVWAALAQPRTVAEVASRTGLSQRQVRYALNRLREEGHAVPAAVPRRRGTYQRVPASPEATR